MRKVALLGFAALSALSTAAPTYSLYTKMKSNTFGSWANESGVSVVWARRGHLSLESNLAVVTKMPFESGNIEQYTAGTTLRYKFGSTDDTFQPAIYTKIKHDLFHTYSQETGFSASLWSKGRISLGANAAVVYNYPIEIHDKRPGYTVGITLSYKL